MALLKYVFLYISLLYCVVFSLHRNSRAVPLIFRAPSLLQFVMGVSVPSTFRNRSFQISGGYQANWDLPTNVTQLHHKYAVVHDRRLSARETGGIKRILLYKYVEQLLGGFGLNGQECLLKAVCEMADFSLERQHDFISDFLHFFLTPSEDAIYENESDPIYDSYNNAEDVGKSHGNCFGVYPMCEISIFDSVDQNV